MITQAAAWPALCRVIGKEAWIEDPGYATADARLDKLPHIFDTIEEWTKTKTKFEVMDILNEVDVPCGPILSMKEIAEERRCARPARWSRSITPRAAST